MSSESTRDPVELSTAILDSGEAHEPSNRVTNQLSEIDDGVAIVESFSHLLGFETDDGLVAFDASHAYTGTQVVAALRGWRSDRIHSLVYTHGHVDHVGGSGAVAADARESGFELPRVVGHDAVKARLDRYAMTNGLNLDINQRQFGGISRAAKVGLGASNDRFLPDDVLRPDTEYREDLTLEIGGLRFELHHDRGETDDHTWAWVPSHRAICAGDLVAWVFPNCGNPQKVQRYPLEWAAALRKMQALDAELLLGAHGLPVRGAERVDRVLGDLATALENLASSTLALMNDGASLDTILQTVSVPAEALTRPWMQPIYDEPEFVVRNIWRLYGGWWDQNPSRLKPPSDQAAGGELVRLAGGIAPVITRAQELADAEDFRLACHLIDAATAAEPDSREAHSARADIYQARRNTELSLMSKGIFAAAARTSRAVVEGGQGVEGGEG